MNKLTPICTLWSVDMSARQRCPDDVACAYAFLSVWLTETILLSWIMIMIIIDYYLFGKRHKQNEIEWSVHMKHADVERFIKVQIYEFTWRDCTAHSAYNVINFNESQRINHFHLKRNCTPLFVSFVSFVLGIESMAVDRRPHNTADDDRNMCRDSIDEIKMNYCQWFC